MEALIIGVLLLTSGVVAMHFRGVLPRRRILRQTPRTILDFRNQLELMVNDRQLERVWEECPCCGYPTYCRATGMAFCELCEWEEDPAADEATFQRARTNFARYGVVYSPDEAATWMGEMPTAAERAYKREFMAICDAVRAGTLSLEQWWEQVQALATAERPEERVEPHEGR